MHLLSEFNREHMRDVGVELHRFASELFPICRSITGDGIRTTLELIRKRIPLRVEEVASGTEVFDWTVPKEWNIRDAFIADVQGNRIVDFNTCNLQVLNYSVPIHKTVQFSELREHLFTIPERPDWIPYRTSYYREDWGFCLSHNQLLAMKDAEYEVCIDSTLADGHLTYGECYLPGASQDEVLISTHACHPSLANDNLSGLVVATALAEMLATRDRRYSYRFLFVPGTIGAITWLARNRDRAGRIRHGLVLTGIGDNGVFHYKKSRRGNAKIDQVVANVLRCETKSPQIMEFSPYGYDERQYCSPGFNLPVGCLMRSVWGTFPEYHTSADNLEFIKPAQLEESLRVCSAVVDVLENDARYRNLSPYCEPQLGKRDLYASRGGETIKSEANARLWVLNFSDGEHSLLDLSDRSGLPFLQLYEAARQLQEVGLLSRMPEIPSLEPFEKPSGSIHEVTYF